MKKSRTHRMLFALLTVVALSALGMPAAAQEKETSDKSQTQATTPATVAAGQKQKISGVIIQRDIENIVVRDYKGLQYNVKVGGSTKIRERKSNPFRGAKKFELTDLSRGLAVEVEGRGDNAGAIVADQIKFSEAEFRVANSVVSLVTPVEGRVTETEARMKESEINAQRLSGQLEELAAVANTANGGAKAAQESADKAMAEAKNAGDLARNANERITATSETLNSRISSLDEFDVAKTITINFRVGSTTLTKDAKAALDEIAEQAKSEKGHVIQVSGFASADGNEKLNRRLSRDRAEAVTSYLIENHDISQRRIITPLGYGEARPAGDNGTRQGRVQNRRVEVAILVSKGLLNHTAGASAQQ